MAFHLHNLKKAIEAGTAALDQGGWSEMSEAQTQLVTTSTLDLIAVYGSLDTDLTGAKAMEATLETALTSTVPDRRPHSRACGFRAHPHGSQCHTNCPSCHGEDVK